MDGMRFGRIHQVVRAQGPTRPAVGRLWRSVGLLTVLLVGVLAFGAASASAVRVSKAEEAEAAAHEEHFEYHATPIEEKTTECNRNVCTEGKSVVPPGEYLVSTAAGFNSLRIHEFAEEYCNGKEYDEGCVTNNKERPAKSADYLAPGYKELYQTIQAGKLDNGYFDEIHESYEIFIYAWKPVEKESADFGPKNEGEPNHIICSLGEFPVNCATGNQFATQTDLAIGGRGPTLGVTRTYNSLLAANQTTPGPFGYGWTGSYSAHIELGYKESEATSYRVATVNQGNGSTVTFDHEKEGGGWTASSSLVEATLVDSGSGYVYTLPDQTKLSSIRQ